MRAEHRERAAADGRKGARREGGAGLEHGDEEHAQPEARGEDELMRAQQERENIQATKMLQHSKLGFANNSKNARQELTEFTI